MLAGQKENDVGNPPYLMLPIADDVFLLFLLLLMAELKPSSFFLFSVYFFFTFSPLTSFLEGPVP